MREIEIKNLVQSQSVKENILKVLDIDDFDYEFVPEDQYPNGLYADFTIKKGNNVKAILELKGSDIGVTDYVRGIGQIMQYQHFADNNMSLKNYHFDNAIAVYLLPSSVIQRDSFNIGLFKYPEKSKIIEINEYNKNVRLITDKELQSLASIYKENKVAISQYYIRDNRLIELYLLLRFCQIKNLLGIKKINRKKTENEFLKKLETINNNNWRNAFIALSSLGLIDNNNIPTNIGSKYATGSFSYFCYEIYKSYIRIYIDLLMKTLINIKNKKECNNNDFFIANNNEIAEEINKLFNNKKVLFLTDSDNRYISSWLNIMRDDYKCISFEPRQSNRKIEYDISIMNETVIMSKIEENKKANEYINRMNNILNQNL